MSILQRMQRTFRTCLGTTHNSGNRSRPRTTSRLDLETLEEREVPAGITYNSGIVYINGSTGNDTAMIKLDTSTMFPQLKVTLSHNYGTDSMSLTTLFAPISKIVFDGGNGNDIVFNHTGYRLYADGGIGNDFLVGGSGNDTLNGSFDDDYIYGGIGNDSLIGGPGHDYLSGYTGNDTLQGNMGNDRLYGQDNNDQLDGGSGADSIYGGNGNDTAYGGTGNDRIEGDAGNDFLYGEEDHDSLYGESGIDVLLGQGGNDYLYGGSDNDYLYGYDGDDVLDGMDGTDYLFGGEDNDSLFGGDQPDFLSGDSGDDYLVGGSENDTLKGGSGDDELRGDNGNDTLNGQDGNDTLSGSSGDDELNGGNNDDVLYGSFGNDTLNGEGGNDRLFGEWDNDVLNGGNDDDYLDGGEHHDTLYGAAGDDQLFGNTGNDYLHGGIGNDALMGWEGIDVLYGNDGFDRELYALNQPGANLFFTTPGDVTVTFANGGKKSLQLNGETVTAYPWLWSSSDIWKVDDAFAHMVWRTEDNVLLKRHDGTALTFYRQGAVLDANNMASGFLGWNSGNGAITIAEQAFDSDQKLRQTVYHEIGHNWDDEGPHWESFKILSGWVPGKTYGQTFPHYNVSTDEQWSYLAASTFARNYGKYNPYEDFATSFAAYFMKYVEGGTYLWDSGQDITWKLSYVSLTLDEI